MTKQDAPKTARERVLDELRKHPDGLSKSRLREIIDGNAGAFRRLISSMEGKGEITVTEETFPAWGPTKVVRAVEQDALAEK